MEERLECIGNGELLQLWAERQMAAQTVRRLWRRRS